MGYGAHILSPKSKRGGDMKIAFLILALASLVAWFMAFVVFHVTATLIHVLLVLTLVFLAGFLGLATEHRPD
jgi:hypothetical protein